MTMRIRQQQIESLRRQAELQFEDWCIQHVRKHWTEESAVFDEVELRKKIRDSIKHGRMLGFTTQKQLAAFVDTTVLLGSGFDRDAQFSEIRAVLDNTCHSFTEKAGMIFGIAVGIHTARVSLSSK